MSNNQSKYLAVTCLQCEYNFAFISLLSVLDILISQTVDQGIQHGDDHRVKHRGHFDCVPGGFGVGHTGEEEDGAVEGAGGAQAGGAGGEGFAMPAG